MVTCVTGGGQEHSPSTASPTNSPIPSSKDERISFLQVNGLHYRYHTTESSHGIGGQLSLLVGINHV